MSKFTPNGSPNNNDSENQNENDMPRTENEMTTAEKRQALGEWLLERIDFLLAVAPDEPDDDTDTVH